MKRHPSVIVAACLSPWDEKFEFMEDLFRRHVRSILRGLTRHVYVFGTAGEGYAVTDRQFDRITRVFREETSQPETRAMVGVISLSLPTIIERIGRARDMGFRFFQISLPAWGALSDRELDTFFSETCGRFPDCGFLHYNLLRSKRLLVGKDYARLSVAHPNLVAVKTGGQDPAVLADLVTQAPEIQFFLTEGGFGQMRDQHECGLLISRSSTHFERAHELFEARGEKLRGMVEETNLIGKALRAGLDPACHMDGVFDKLLCRLHMPDFPLRLLPPYQSATEDAFRKFKEAMPQEWLSISAPVPA